MLLSICIPTYNRRDCLRQCIESILSQEVFSCLEIVIADNSDNDETYDMIQEYIWKYENIVYSKNIENIGFDKNVLKVVSMASGKYCCIIGDDDAFFEESLWNILSVLQEDKASYYISNSWSYDNKLSLPVSGSANISIRENKFYLTLKDFIFSLQPDRIKTVSFFGMMSWQFFLKGIWDSFLMKESFIWTQTIHLFVLVSSMKNLPFILIAQPTIKSRSDNLRWDSFGLSSAIKREKVTLDTFQFIARLYEIPYSKWKLYLSFFWSYIRNIVIFYVKKYLIRDQATVTKIKTVLSKFLKN